MLTIEKKITPHNFTVGRGGSSIAEITIHHAAGTGPLTIMEKDFHNPNRKASAHYGIRDKQICQFVDEENTAWTNSVGSANRRAITIEVVNSAGGPDWPISLTSYETLIELVYSIAKRHKLFPLKKAVSLTWHSLYAVTKCPGPWLLEHVDDLISRVNTANDLYKTYLEPWTFDNPENRFALVYRVRMKNNDPATQQGAFSEFENAKALCITLNGLDGQNGHYAVFNQDGLKVYPKG